MDKLKEMPFLDKYPVFRKLAEIGDLRKLTPEEHEMYDEDIKIMRDLYATHEFEIKKRRRAVEKALKEGEKKGIEKGIEKGMEKGIIKGKIETAKRFLAMGLTPEQVANGSQLPIEQVLQLLSSKTAN